MEASTTKEEMLQCRSAPYEEIEAIGASRDYADTSASPAHRGGKQASSSARKEVAADISPVEVKTEVTADISPAKVKLEVT